MPNTLVDTKRKIEGIRELVLSTFSALHFNEANHTYTVRGKFLPSVTGKIKKYYPPFNEAFWLPRSAKKASRLEGREVTEHELQHRWQTKNKTACDLGHETHDFLEYYKGLKKPDTPQKVAGVKYLTDILQERIIFEGIAVYRYAIIARELRMYSKLYGYAGTADLIILDLSTWELIIADYKTNGDIFKTFGMMLEPFQYMENHPYNHYQLQLNFYQIMLEEMTGLIVGQRELVYLKATGEYKRYPLIDLREELIGCLTENTKQVNLGMYGGY